MPRGPAVAQVVMKIDPTLADELGQEVELLEKVSGREGAWWRGSRGMGFGGLRDGEG
jgi:hypothetical protein